MPKQVDHAERRKSIASAAVEVIGTSGLDGARLRDVARAAEVTTGAVTHYFQDKDEVLVAALDEVAQRILSRIGELEASESHPEEIGRLTFASADTARDMRVWLAFWGRAIADPALAAVHKGYYDEFRARLATLIRRNQRTGRVRPDLDAEAAADAIIAAVDGVGTRIALEPGDWPVERQTQTLRLLLDPLFGAT